MSDYNFEISLRPVEHYFFGGERTFNRAGDDKSSFYAVSNLYPQQTTLLGLLRYLLLEQNNLLPLSDQPEYIVEQTIGKASFRTHAREAQQFGHIKALAPLLLRKGGAYYRIGHELANDAYSNPDHGDQVLTADGLRDGAPKLNNYKAKEGLPLKAISLEMTDTAVDFNCIFREQEHIGILKQSTEEGFFKQKVYSLHQGWHFSLFARLEGDFKLHDGLVRFGADQKLFYVTVRKVSAADQPHWGHVAGESGSLTLLSDAKVGPDIYKHCRFAISSMTDFRTVRMGFKGSRFAKDGIKTNLLRRGSVLFAKAGQLQELTKTLNANLNYRQIGFNQYFISKT